MSSVASISNGLYTPAASDIMTLDTPTGDDDLWPTDQDVAEMALMTYNPPQSLVWNRHSLRRLPATAIPLKMIGEGAANVVFEIGFPQGDPATPKFQGWLLRVAKAPINKSPSRFNYIKQQEYHVKKVQYILGKDRVVKQELVVLRNSNIVRKLNNFLTSIDHQRKEKFRGSFVTESNWGFLVEDMRPKNPDEAVLIEFKPKWLVQSPSAPPNAIRCRQCAMELSNFIKNPRKITCSADVKPCPLGLARETAPISDPDADPFRIAPELKSKLPDHAAVFDKITNHEIIEDLRAAQIAADPDGPLGASRDDPSFCWAMTIRDCTCFVQISRHPTVQEPLKIRLGDFDFKDPLVKFNRWKKAEQDLIDKGFYTADWILSSRTFYHPPSNCLLERQPRISKPSLIHLRHPDSDPFEMRNNDYGICSVRTDVSEQGWGAGLKTYCPSSARQRDEPQRPARPDPPPLE